MSLLLSAALLCAIQTTAPAGTLDDFGQPARARNILEGILVRDRHTGRETLVLSNNNEATGAELIFLDFDNDSAQVVRAPTGAGAEGLSEIPGDRLLLGAFYNGSIMVFDLNEMQFVKTLQFPGQSYVWGFAMGSDGRAYCGTFPGGKLGALDLNTYALEDLGNGSPPNFYLRQVVATPDGRLLCRFIVEDPMWMVFDPALKRFDPLPKELRQMKRLAIWNGYVVAGQKMFDGRDFHEVTLPFAFPSSFSKPAQNGRLLGVRPSLWEFDPFLTTRDALYVRDGTNLWNYQKDQRQFTLVSSVDLRGGRFLATSSDGRILGIRGEDYFVIQPGDTQLQPKPIPGESSPRFISFLRADPKGRIWGGPPYGQTLFWVDPGSRRTVNTSAISDNGGEVYDVAFLDGFAYAAAYAWGEVIRYSPDQPWDQWNQKNPKTILQLANRGYGRPTGGIIVGPGRKLYSGWTPAVGYGGAIAITDPDTEQSDLLENPLGAQQIMGLATDGKLLYIGTGLGGTGLPSKPGESPRLGIMDPETRKIIWQTDVPGAERVQILGYDPITRIIPISVDTHLRFFDTVTRTFQDRATDAPPVASWSNGLPGDGRIYYGSGKQVLSLDLQSGAIEVLAQTPGYVNNVAVAPDGTVYAGAWSNLYAVRLPAH